MNRYTSESTKSLGIPFSNGMLIGGEIIDPRYDTDPRSRIEQLTARNLTLTIPNQTIPGNNSIHFNPDMRNRIQLTYAPTIVINNIGDEERETRKNQPSRHDEQRVMEHGRLQERIPPHYAPERYPNTNRDSDRYPNYYSDSPYPERNEHDYYYRRERAGVSRGPKCNHYSENNQYPVYHSGNDRNHYYESNRNVGCDRNQHCDHYSENNRYPVYQSENDRNPSRNHYYESNRNVSHSGCDRNQHCNHNYENRYPQHFSHSGCDRKQQIDHYHENRYPQHFSHSDGCDRKQQIDHYYENRNIEHHSHCEYDPNPQRDNYSDDERPLTNIERSPACVQRKSVTRDLVRNHVPHCQPAVKPAVHQANPPRTRCSASPAATAASCPKICQAKNRAKNVKLSVSWFIPAGGAAAPDLRQIPADVKHESDNPGSAPDSAPDYDEMDPTAQDTDVLEGNVTGDSEQELEPSDHVQHDDTVVAPQGEEEDQEMGVSENVDEPQHEPQHEQDEPQYEQDEPQNEQDEPQYEQDEPQHEQEVGDDANDEHHLYPNIQDLQEPSQEPKASELETATVEGNDEGLVQEPEDLSVPEEDDQHYDEDISETAPSDSIDVPVDPINVPDSYVDEVPPIPTVKKSRKGFLGSVSNMFKSKRQETSDKMKEGIKNAAESVKQKGKDAAERQADKAKEMLKKKADAAKEKVKDKTNEIKEKAKAAAKEKAENAKAAAKEKAAKAKAAMKEKAAKAKAAMKEKATQAKNKLRNLFKKKK